MQNLNHLASLCDCPGSYFTDLDRHYLTCAYTLAVKHATIRTAINLKIALNDEISQRLATRHNEIESLGKLLTLRVWSKTIRPKYERVSPMNDYELFIETPAQLQGRILRDSLEILRDSSTPISERIPELQWRSELLNELCRN